jgi:hypothetical protein
MQDLEPFSTVPSDRFALPALLALTWIRLVPVLHRTVSRVLLLPQLYPFNPMKMMFPTPLGELHFPLVLKVVDP